MAEFITHKCRNYEICYGTLPIFNKFGNPQLCNDCNVMFKNSPSIQTTNGQCAVCCVDGECFLQQECKHLLCKICFQKCKFGLPDNHSPNTLVCPAVILFELYHKQRNDG